MLSLLSLFGICCFLIAGNNNKIVVQGQSCDSGKGFCIDTKTESCSGGTLYPGYCPGASNIVCCEYPTCDSARGQCIDTNKQSCTTGVLKTGYCPGPSNIMCCEPSNLPEECKNGGPPLLTGSYEFTLKSQGFSGHPGALVYVPTKFSKSSKSIEVIVYVHGYWNCIRNIVQPSDHGCNCSANGDVRDAYDLIGQFERAVQQVGESANNWIFVAAEVAYDQANDSPGHWADKNLFRNFIDELFTEHMAPIIGTYDASTVERVRIVSHSGGYYVIGNMATVGGMGDVVMDLVLLDSLYTNFDQFDAFVTSHLCSFGTGEGQFRFSTVYTEDGGTMSNNIAMEKRAAGWISSSGCANSTVLFNNPNVDVTLSQSDIQKHSLIFSISSFSHNDVPRNMFYDFLVSSV